MDITFEAWEHVRHAITVGAGEGDAITGPYYAASCSCGEVFTARAELGHAEDDAQAHVWEVRRRSDNSQPFAAVYQVRCPECSETEPNPDEWVFWAFGDYPSFCPRCGTSAEGCEVVGE